MKSYSISVNNKRMSVITPLSAGKLIRELKWKFGEDAEIEIKG